MIREPDFQVRFDDCVRDWRVRIVERLETQSSIVGIGSREGRPVVLKVVKRAGDEWRSGQILEAFDGKGMARVYEHVEGATLLERLDPGTSLAAITTDASDERSIGILADVIRRMSPGDPPPSVPTVSDWGKAFQWYRTTGDEQIPGAMLDRGEHIYATLAASQKRTRLLHGDLQHYNVLLDSSRGWLAIDPKGVVGEVEYEIGASLRNPYELPALLASTSTIERRIRRFETELGLDPRRMLAWAFAEAVLSAIWSVEDGYRVPPGSVPIVLGHAIAPMLDSA